MSDLNTISIVKFDKIYIDDFFQLFEQTLTRDLEYSYEEGTYLVNNFYRKDVFLSENYHLINEVLIALSNDKVVGFITANKSYCGVSNFSWMGIKKEYRRIGIGSKLMSEMVKVVEHNSHLIEFCTDASNLIFYKKIGYKIIGIRRNGYFGKKHYILNKDISKKSKPSKSNYVMALIKLLKKT